MPKRPAETPLEDVHAVSSHAIKKQRKKERRKERKREAAQNGSLPVRGQNAKSATNGHSEDVTKQEPVADSAVDEEDEEEEEEEVQNQQQQQQQQTQEPTTSQDPDQDEEDEEDDYEEYRSSSKQAAPIDGYSDLYLDTISRARLDFDFEKLCSVTLSNINVYACLVCGKYFAGRGPKTPVYLHTVEAGHHVYINMQSKKIYVLPEGYEVKSKTLDDIRFVVDPVFTVDEVKALDRNTQPAWDLAGRKYMPGYVGLNNIKANDYFNVVVQALSHVPPLRNFLMLEDLSSRSQLVQRFSVLIRKIWNPKAFKSHVSPHELLQEISTKSGKKFNLTEQADPAEFLSWFLNNLHLALGGSKTKMHSSIVQNIFQGRVRVESQTITAMADASDRLRFENTDIKSQTSPFIILTLDLPPAPLFQDGQERNIIPQVPLQQILNKYNGIVAQEKLDARMRYRLQHPLPPYLIMHIKRFQSNKFLQSQRNPTIVTFNPRALDMSPYVEPNPSVHSPSEPIVYDLVANITYEGVKARDDSVEGESERKVWKVQVREGAASVDRPTQQWWEMQDLFVESVNMDLLATKETYIMVWERRKHKRASK